MLRDRPGRSNARARIDVAGRTCPKGMMKCGRGPLPPCDASRSPWAIPLVIIIIIDNNKILERAKIVLHPVRLRILQALAIGEDTTQGLTDRLGDVPRSSIYRHLRRLVAAGLVIVAETRRVRGAVERRYRLGEGAHLSAEDVAGVPAEKHLEMFTTYVMTLVQDFAGYLGAVDEPDFDRDRVGYSEVVVHVTDREFDRIAERLRAATRRYLGRAPSPGLRPRKLSVITFPVAAGEPEEDKRRAATP